MTKKGQLDCLFVATPTATHFKCAKYGLEHGLHLFVEKPLTLSSAESKALSDLAVERKLVNMVGFHNRFIGTFREARRILKAGALGPVTNIRASAVGQVVIKEQGSTWRSRKAEGGRLPPRLRLPRRQSDELPRRPAITHRRRPAPEHLLEGRRGCRLRP